MQLNCKRKSNFVKLVIFGQIVMVAIVTLEVIHMKSKQRVKERKFILEKADNERAHSKIERPFEYINYLRERILPLKTERNDLNSSFEKGSIDFDLTIKAQRQFFENENIEISDENDSTLITNVLFDETKSEDLSNTPLIVEMNHFKNTVKIDNKQIEVKTNGLKHMSFHDAEKVIVQATKWLTVNETEKDDRLNRHKFYYHLNSNLCSKKKTSMVILVHSAVKHIRQRRRIRSTWGAVKTRVSQPTIIFMLGESFPENKTLQLEIEKESRKHGDIVQGDFVDTYKNLTYKLVMAIHWVMSHCADVRTIVKIDDDVFVDVHKLVNFSATYGSIPNSVYGKVFTKGLTQRRGKWAVTDTEYPFHRFPLYCGGAAFIMSMDVARRLDKASSEVGFFWIDDVYMTGFVRRVAQVDIRPFKPGHRLATTYRYMTTLTKNNLKNFMFFTGNVNWDLLYAVLFNDDAR